MERPRRRAKGSGGLWRTIQPAEDVRPPPAVTDATGQELIRLTAAGCGRLLNLRTRLTRPAPFHEHMSRWRRRYQVRARRCRYARRTADL
jgi:hypothetical protein